MVLFSVIETVEDYNGILMYAKKHSLKDIVFVIMSLETLAYVEKQKAVNFIHIWNLIDMDEILQGSLIHSQEFTKKWIEYFTEQTDGFHDEASHYHIDVNFFQPTCTMHAVSEKISEIAKKRQWRYLVPKPQLAFWDLNFRKGEGTPHHILFQAILSHHLKRNGVEIYQTTWRNRVTIHMPRFILWQKITLLIASDVLALFIDKLLLRKNVKNALRKTEKYVDVLMTGWGRDHVKVLSFGELIRRIESHKNTSFLHLVSRPNKLGVTPVLKTIHTNVIDIKETIRAISLGPRLSLLPWFDIWTYLPHVFLAVRKRIHALAQKEIVSDPEWNFLYEPAVKANLSFLLFFTFREAYISTKLLQTILDRVHVKILVGSDSGSASARVELLTAKARGVVTVSTPHGLHPYSIPKYNYLADIVLTTSSITARLIANVGVHSSRIVPIGCRLSDGQPQIKNKGKKIVIATRSRGGRWTNISSKQNRYHQELNVLLNLLSKKGFTVVIKSHPNGDYHQYYDLLAEKYENVSHDRTGWKKDRFFAECGYLICLGELPSLFMYALSCNIPIFFLQSVMSKTLKQSNYFYEGVAVANSAQEVSDQIVKFCNDSTYTKNILEKQARLAKELITNYPEESFLEVIESTLQTYAKG